MNNLKQAKAAATLNKIFRYPEGIMSRKEWLNLHRIKGATVKEVRRRDYKAEEKIAEDLAWQRANVPLGNPNYPSTAAYLKQKAEFEKGIYKTEYRLNIPGQSTFFDLNKTEFEYFQALELAEDKATEAMELTYKIEAGIATDEEIEEDEQKEFDFFNKYC